MKSAADVWEKVKSLMESSMTAVSIETWFGDVEAVALEDTRLVLCVPTDFKRNIIRTRFQSGVEAALKELFSFDVDVALLLPEEREVYTRQTAVPTSAKILLDGREVSFTAYEIGGNNYFKLRDVGEAFDFGVDWDEAAQTIKIDTSKGYTAG